DGSSFPPCPQCGKPMVLRMAKTGQNAGKQFLGCSGYPDCKGVTNL
ncbi:MAG: four helix bundle protein, partial [Gammaproteobacteria bacterium]|nr:four helix bundle protein [Gammaproteobacteria bacterium]